MRRFTVIFPIFSELFFITLLALLFVSLWSPIPPGEQPSGLETTHLRTALLDPTHRPTQLEYERLAGVLYPARIGLERYGHIPTWNPYLGGGEPLINNAFSYLFNPFHSLPVLLADSYVQGTKLATFIALLLAGYNMWALAWAVGIGAAGRILAGALYMTGGGIAGKFYAGHFQLALSLAWPPLVIAAFWWTLRSRSRFAPAAFAAAFALLFFAGNIYYVLHTLLCCAAIFALHLIINRPPNPASPELGTRHLLGRAALAAAFAFGLAAVQFFPIWLTRDYVVHDNQTFTADGRLEGAYDLSQAFANLTHPWPDWNNFSTSGLDVSVDYAYIGSIVFLLIALALLVLFSTHVKRFERLRHIAAAHRTQNDAGLALTALILAIFMMVWGTGQSVPLEFLYHRVPLLAEFRFVGRALSIAALWWILLGALAVDLLWRNASRILRAPDSFVLHSRARLLRMGAAALLIWLYFLVYSLANTSTRSAMVLYNYSLLNALDPRRFTSFQSVVIGLGILILLAILFDALLLLVRGLFTRPVSIRALDWRSAATRLLQLALLALTFGAIADTMRANSGLYKMEPVYADFSVFYPTIRASDPDTPFPAVSEPYAPSAFAAYEAEIRNAGLDEGWRPGVMPGIIPYEAGALSDLSRWAVVSRAYGGTSFDLSYQFVTDNGYIQRECAFIHPFPDTTDPCNLNSSTTAVLYEQPDALPYTFVAPADTLVVFPADLKATTVGPAQVIQHRQDTITIRAEAPLDGAYYLIVQETHFPGWRVTVDDMPVQSTTADTYHDVPSNRGYIAVPMLSGAHTYNLRFEPPGFTLGAIITLVTLVLISLYLVLARKGLTSRQ